jgi:hypothetical protein
MSDPEGKVGLPVSPPASSSKQNTSDSDSGRTIYVYEDSRGREWQVTIPRQKWTCIGFVTAHEASSKVCW